MLPLCREQICWRSLPGSRSAGWWNGRMVESSLAMNWEPHKVTRIKLAKFWIYRCEKWSWRIFPDINLITKRYISDFLGPFSSTQWQQINWQVEVEILSWLLVSSEYHYLWVHWCTRYLSRWLISHHSWWGYWEISLLWIVLNGTLSCSGISGFQAKVFEHFQQKMVNGNWNIFWTYFQCWRCVVIDEDIWKIFSRLVMIGEDILKIFSI